MNQVIAKALGATGRLEIAAGKPVWIDSCGQSLRLALATLALRVTEPLTLREMSGVYIQARDLVVHVSLTAGGPKLRAYRPQNLGGMVDYEMPPEGFCAEITDDDAFFWWDGAGVYVDFSPMSLGIYPHKQRLAHEWPQLGWHSEGEEIL